MFWRKTKETPCVKQSDNLCKAEAITKNYSKISSCCGIIASVNEPRTECVYDCYGRGWKTSTYALESAGIDVDLVYEYIADLAEKEKEKAECEINKLCL